MNPNGSPPEAVVIDSLLNVDQYCASDKSSSSVSDGKPGRDIAEVAAATELILPKGSFRTTSSVRQTQTIISMFTQIVTDLFLFCFLIRLAAQLLFFYMALCESISKSVWTG